LPNCARLHRIDENASGEVAPLLAFLRELQRRHAVAVVLVHHARKGAGTIRAGQALRGSSEFHAWGDSNLYLRRGNDDHIVLTVEHRAAAAMQGVALELAQCSNSLALHIVQPDCQSGSRTAPPSIDQRITGALANARQPQPFADLRASCRVRTTTLYQRLAAMTAAGTVVKFADASPLAEHRAARPRSHNPCSDLQHSRTTATSRFRFPDPLEKTGSGSRKLINFGDRNTIKQQDHAQIPAPTARISGFRCSGQRTANKAPRRSISTGPIQYGRSASLIRPQIINRRHRYHPRHPSQARRRAAPRLSVAPGQTGSVVTSMACA
jgi:hypothetical protein